MTSGMNGARRRTLATRLAGACARQDTFSNACTLAILVVASAPALASAAAPPVPTALAPRSGAAFQAATAAVSNCNDTGSGSLRLAVAAAASGAIIDMTMLPCSLITLTTGAILIDHAVANLTLLGPTDHDLEINGNGLGRVLVHNGEGTLVLDHLAVTKGSYTSGYYGGGCIYAFGSVVLQHSRVSDCTLHLPSYDAPGGGIYAKVDLTMTNSVLGGNSAIA